MAGISNFIEGKSTGAQCAGIVNKAGKVEGVQAAGIANVAFDTVKGAQLGGIINGAKTANVQAAGIINGAMYVKGVQVAGIVNVAKRVDGVQIAGFVNLAKRVNGVQIAGLINIADSCDYPIGFINIIRNGDRALGVTVDDLGTTVAALRSGGRIMYGIMGFASNQYQSIKLYGLEAGLGAHLPVSRHFRINAEITTQSLFDFDEQTVNDNGISIMPAVRIGPFEFFAGAGVNVLISTVAPPYLSLIDHHIEAGFTNAGANVETRVGYKAGLQVHF